MMFHSSFIAMELSVVKTWGYPETFGLTVENDQMLQVVAGVPTSMDIHMYE